MKTINYIAALTLIAGLTLPHLTHGAQDGAERSGLPAELVQAVTALLEDADSAPATYREVIQAGRDRAIFCNSCHGRDGNSRLPTYPSLAGQNPVYLLDQIEQFADQRREKPVMNALAASFTQEEKVLLAVYYAIAPPRAAGGDVALARGGGPVYHSRCAQCHGVDGRGEQGYARLAGQQPQYLANTLREYRSGSSRRRSSEMDSIAASLSDTDIEAVAAYIANLR
jgi:cytochrome c553